MKRIDRLLKAVGLARTSQNPFVSWEFTRSLYEHPDTCDVVFKNGQRFTGAIDPSYDVQARKWSDHV